MCFPQFQIFCLPFFNSVLIAALNSVKIKFASRRIKTGGSKASVNLGPVDEGPIRYMGRGKSNSLPTDHLCRQFIIYNF